MSIISQYELNRYGAKKWLCHILSRDNYWWCAFWFKTLG